jgi:dipeptidyl aminopeptidase/acylaminoacyl peptidase
VQITAFDWRSNYYPSVKAHAAEYRDVSPVYGADKVTAPVLLLHGGNDQRVELEQTGFMERSLRKAGKSVQVVTSLTEIHGLPDQQDRFDFYRTVAAFLLEKMPPDAPH